ncbi:MAG: hypothetical protein GWN18_15870 [Thermoplasmata archaeon]|nr:hypothetical protein [Thermoplasmata archaeon]NIS21416.1 hypothetical protein [Thermoplasmata archaeon]NIT78969.1 hypothetical protein [Thermoplasmata archaeon]NIU50468.1 hypothetical protein [Thermoplasmata archaeon]NIV80181.1 hypothetical protein [Thermoplasmata archaeon]
MGGIKRLGRKVRARIDLPDSTTIVIYTPTPCKTGMDMGKKTSIVLIVTVFLLAATTGCLDRYPKPDHDNMEGMVTINVTHAELTELGQDSGIIGVYWSIHKIVNSYIDEDDPQDQYWWDEMRIKWEELRFIPRNGPLEGIIIPIREFNSEMVGESIMGWYEEVNGSVKGPNPDDRFWLTGLNESFAGTMFDVAYNGEWYGGQERFCTLFVPDDLS